MATRFGYARPAALKTSTAPVPPGAAKDMANVCGYACGASTHPNYVSSTVRKPVMRCAHWRRPASACASPFTPATVMAAPLPMLFCCPTASTLRATWSLKAGRGTMAGENAAASTRRNTGRPCRRGADYSPMTAPSARPIFAVITDRVIRAARGLTHHSPRTKYLLIPPPFPENRHAIDHSTDTHRRTRNYFVDAV